MSTSFSFVNRRAAAMARSVVGVAFGPPFEESICRGYLYRAAEWVLAARIAHPGRGTALVVAAVFALSHLAKGATLSWVKAIAPR